jgi:hypothetical protein
MIVEPIKPVENWNIDDWRNAFNTLSEVHSSSAAYDYEVLTAIAHAAGLPSFDGSIPPDEWASKIIATVAALRAELDTVRAQLIATKAWPGVEKALPPGATVVKVSALWNDVNSQSLYSVIWGKDEEE